MQLVYGYTTHQLPADYLKTMVVPTGIDAEYWEIAIVVAKVFKVDLSDVVGFKDTTEKIIACYIELRAMDNLHLRILARKYNINPNYLKKRIQELEQNLKQDEAMRRNVQLILVSKKGII